MRPFLLVSMLALGCGSPPRPAPVRPMPPLPQLSCTVENCGGCCLNGVCMHTTSESFCGAQAQACVACPSGNVCNASGACVPRQPGNPVPKTACPVFLEPLHVGSERPLTAAWAGETAAWGVGPQGALWLVDGRLEVPPNDATVGAALRSVWSPDDGRTVWFVREGVAAAIHRSIDGLSLDEASPTGTELYALWGRSPTDVYVGGGSEGTGALAHWDGQRWSTVGLGNSPIIAISGPASGIVAAISKSELFLQRAGTFVSMGATPTTLAGGLTAWADGSVWATPVSGPLQIWKDGRWATSATVVPAMTTLWAHSNQMVFGAAPASALWIYDGFNAGTLPNTPVLNAISGTTADRALAVGQGAAVLARCATPEELNGDTVVQPGSFTSGGSGGRDCRTVCSVRGPNGTCLAETSRCS